MGGHDTHTKRVQLAPLNATVGTHTNLLKEVSECMFAFQRAVEQLDFCRTFPTKSQGSDHTDGAVTT